MTCPVCGSALRQVSRIPETYVCPYRHYSLTLPVNREAMLPPSPSPSPSPEHMTLVPLAFHDAFRDEELKP